MMKKIIWIVICITLIASFVSCGKSTKNDTTNLTNTPELTPAQDLTKALTQVPTQIANSKGNIILATTTSTQDSGLLDAILPEFTKQTKWKVDTIAVGSGEALKMGENGEADVLLVHAKEKEEAFIKAGFGLKRYDVMYNDFIIVGPADIIKKNSDITKTFQTIYDKKYTFISRGDESGTHTKELSIWNKLGFVPTENPNYISAGQGMGATLFMADEKKGFTLSDRATWLATKAKTAMEIVCEKDPLLLNYYGVIAVNPKTNPTINAEGAQAFIEWLLSEPTQKMIGNFGVKEYREVLFHPNAQANQ